jgi:hypothetical protein
MATNNRLANKRRRRFNFGPSMEVILALPDQNKVILFNDILAS